MAIFVYLLDLSFFVFIYILLITFQNLKSGWSTLNSLRVKYFKDPNKLLFYFID